MKGKYFGDVTARVALMHSLNNATIELASMVGYNNVASLARDAGIKSARGTPAMAIGAYDATPLDMSGAYTVFANSGVKIDPWMLASVRSPNGDVMNDYTPATKPVLDPRAAYLTVSLMQNVLNGGTGSIVRRLGFTAPAAGKTGTSHDAWFAGFTSNLSASSGWATTTTATSRLKAPHAAAPIWAGVHEARRGAASVLRYAGTSFRLRALSRCASTRLRTCSPTRACPDNVYYAAFLDGTQPTDTCDHAGGDQRNLFQRIFGARREACRAAAGADNAASSSSCAVAAGPSASNAPVAQTQPAPEPQQTKKKRGFFSRLFGGKKDDDTTRQQPPPQQNPPPPPQ